MKQTQEVSFSKGESTGKKGNAAVLQADLDCRR